MEEIISVLMPYSRKEDGLEIHYSSTVKIPKAHELFTFPLTHRRDMFLEEQKSTFRETALSYLSGILVRSLRDVKTDRES